jgi:four helix bundle protein
MKNGELEKEKSSDDSDKKTFDIRDRAFSFAVRIVKLCEFLEKHSKVSKNLIRQLLDAGTSVGANLEEAQGWQSKADFISKNAISLKEARESNYWLRLILATTNFEDKIKKGIEELIEESSEIAKIVAAIIISAKDKS